MAHEGSLHYSVPIYMCGIIFKNKTDTCSLRFLENKVTTIAEKLKDLLLLLAAFPGVQTHTRTHRRTHTSVYAPANVRQRLSSRRAVLIC